MQAKPESGDDPADRVVWLELELEREQDDKLEALRTIEALNKEHELQLNRLEDALEEMGACTLTGPASDRHTCRDTQEFGPGRLRGLCEESRQAEELAATPGEHAPL